MPCSLRPHVRIHSAVFSWDSLFAVAFDIRVIHDSLHISVLSSNLHLPLADIMSTEAHEICGPSHKLRDRRIQLTHT